MKLTYIALSALFLVGCGSTNDNNNTPPTAKELLVGKVLYSTDDQLDEPTGYYRDIYSSTRVVETEHAEDGTQIYEDVILQAHYSGDSITVSFGNESQTCRVSQIAHAFQFVCTDGSSFLEYDSVARIPR